MTAARKAQGASTKTKSTALASHSVALLPPLFVHATRAMLHASDEERLAAATLWREWARAHPAGKTRALSSFEEAELDGALGVRVRVVAGVCGASARTVRRRPASDTADRLAYGNAQRFVLRDRARHELATLDVIDAALLGALVRAWKSRELLRIEGRMLALPDDGSLHGPERPWRLFVEAIEPITTRLSLLAPSEVELARASAWLKKSTRGEHGVLDAVLREIGKHRPRPPQASPAVRCAMEAAVAQAFSAGRIGKSRGEIHIGVFGPPGVGKQSVHDAAELLNDPCARVLASGITDASLLGATVQTHEGHRMVPGLLDEADGGVLAMEDLHAMTSASARTRGDVLNAITTTGVLPPGKLGSRRRAYAIRLLVDGNPEAHLTVGGTGGRPRGARLHEQLPFLGRLDGLFVLTVSSAEAWDAAAMLMDLPDEEQGEAERASARMLRIAIAMQLDRLASIDLGPARAALHAALHRLRARADEMSPELGVALQPARIQLTLRRFTAAHARMGGRPKASATDVQWAEAMTEHRIDGMKALVSAGGRAQSDSPIADASARLAILRRAHGGETIGLTEIIEALREGGIVVTKKTVQRDLRLPPYERVGHGRYRVPPP